MNENKQSAPLYRQTASSLIMQIVAANIISEGVFKVLKERNY